MLDSGSPAEHFRELLRNSSSSGTRDSPMNLLTNGFVNNCGRPSGPSEQFESDMVELGQTGSKSSFGDNSQYGVTGADALIVG
jgi:hypothetical protein